jgi:hypothetical protein
MIIDPIALDTWERGCVTVNGTLIHVRDAIRRGAFTGDVEGLKASVEAAQAANWETRKQLLSEGAIDSIRAHADESRMLEGLSPLPSPSLSQMDSPANHRLHAALVAARAAAEDVRRERRGDESLVEALGDWIEGIENEIYGPACMREGR